MTDFWTDAARTLGTVAPMLASAVGGPLAGAATSAIIKALGLPDDTTQDVAAQAVLGANAEQLIALKKADQDFAAKMAELDLDRDKLSYDDRANARARESTVKDHAPMILGLFVTVGFFGLLAMMAFHDLPTGNQTILNTMVGALGTGFALVLSYYFGASVPVPVPVKA